MIKGKAPSVTLEKNTLVVSYLGSSKFKISEGMVLVGGSPFFREEEEFEIDDLDFPFRIGIEMEGVKENTVSVLAYDAAIAGQNLTIDPIAVSRASLPDNFSNPSFLELEKPVVVGYSFDNRNFRNCFKSLATVEENGEGQGIRIIQHTYGPLFFRPSQTSYYGVDYFGIREFLDNPFLGSLPAKNILL
jgi:hypothetical protein